MPQHGDSNEEPRWIVDLKILCPKHDQAHLDEALVTEESSRMIERWLQEHDCPAGHYRAGISERQNGRKMKGRFGHFEAKPKTGILSLWVQFGRTQDCRVVELVMPKGVSPELVYNLVTGKAAKLQYAETSQEVELIFEMVLSALRSSLCTGEFYLHIGEMNHTAGKDGEIHISGYRGTAMVGCVKIGDKPAYDISVDCLRNPVREAGKLFKAGQAIDTYCESGQVVQDVLADHDWEKEEQEWQLHVRKVCYNACYELLVLPEFPEVPESTVKQIFGKACREYEANVHWRYFKDEYLDNTGHKKWAPKGFIYEWLACTIDKDDCPESEPKWLATCHRVKAEVERLAKIAGSHKEEAELHDESIRELVKTIEWLKAELDEAEEQLKTAEANRSKHAEGCKEFVQLKHYELLMQGPFGELAQRLEAKHNQRSE